MTETLVFIFDTVMYSVEDVYDCCLSGWCNARAGWEAAGIDFGALYCMEAPPLLQTPTTPYLLILWVNLLEGERFG